MAAVLDTHASIGLIDGREGVFLPAMLAHIEQAARRGEVPLSAIVFWEVAMLDARGRIKLSLSCTDWCEQVQARPGIHIVPPTPAISIDSTRLPGDFRGDPDDRRHCSGKERHRADQRSQHSGLHRDGNRQGGAAVMRAKIQPLHQPALAAFVVPGSFCLFVGGGARLPSDPLLGSANRHGLVCSTPY